MLAIVGKEFRSFFTSVLGYAYVAVYMIFIGIYFAVYNLQMAYANFEYSLSSIVFLFIVIIPILTMRIMAEEYKNKTDQLLLTSPISVEKMVCGKYLGVLSVFGITVLINLIYPLILGIFGTINYGLTYYAILGFFLLGAAYIAIGMFISSLTESVVISTVVTFVVVLASYLMTSLSSMIPSDNKSTWITVAVLIIIVCLVLYFMIKNTVISITIGAIAEIIAAILFFAKPSVYDNVLASILKWVCITEPFTYFCNGVVDAGYIVYYLSLIGVFIFLTMQIIKKKRWS